MNARLRPFWSTVLPRRRVAVSLYTSAPPAGQEGKQRGRMSHRCMLLRSTILTDTQGHFVKDILIPWETLRNTPFVLSSIDGDGQNLTPNMIPEGWYLDVEAELFPDDGNSSGTLSNDILVGHGLLRQRNTQGRSRIRTIKIDIRLLACTSRPQNPVAQQCKPIIPEILLRLDRNRAGLTQLRASLNAMALE